MRLPKWFVSISVLATIGVAVGWLWDSDEIASGVAVDSPESAAAPTVAPVQDQISPPANALPAPDLLQTRPTALPSAPEPTPIPTAAKVVAPAPAASPPLVPTLPTLVDERRDQLRRQSDAYHGPRRQMPSWFARYDDAAERYRDARRSQYRRQRDLGRQRHARRTDAVCPWRKPRRDRAARHSYQRQMEQLNRRAYREAYRYQSPYGVPGPGGWR